MSIISYSKKTAVENPGMILREYQYQRQLFVNQRHALLRQIDDMHIEVSAFSTRLNVNCFQEMKIKDFVFRVDAVNVLRGYLGLKGIVEKYESITTKIDELTKTIDNIDEEIEDFKKKYLTN